VSVVQSCHLGAPDSGAPAVAVLVLNVGVDLDPRIKEYVYNIPKVHVPVLSLCWETFYLPHGKGRCLRLWSVLFYPDPILALG